MSDTIYIYLFIYLQMKTLLAFKSTEDDGKRHEPSACADEIQESLRNFHTNLLQHSAMPTLESLGDKKVCKPVEAPKAPSLSDRLLQLVGLVKKEMLMETTNDNVEKPGEWRFVKM